MFSENNQGTGGFMIKIEPTGKSLGATISNVDMANLDQSAFDEIHAAWLEHLVLRFRGQTLDDTSLAAFSRRFGKLDNAPIGRGGDYPIPDRPEITIISNIIEGGKAIGGLGNSEAVWHSDMTYVDMPPKASLLYGMEIPNTGGDTWFCNMYRVYEDLPEAMKTRIAGLRCKHDSTRTSSGSLRTGFAEQYSPEEQPGEDHPLIVRHPETSRQALYLGRRRNAYIVDMSAADSDVLLDEIWDHANASPHSWAQKWAVGDLVLWDNRCTMHRRDGFDDAERRLMHRTQVQGDIRPAT
jgi:taurine dioxygenase